MAYTYVVQFAPDGVHWQTIKKGNVNSMWSYFNFETELTVHKAFNPQARFRLINLNTKQVIGTK